MNSIRPLLEFGGASGIAGHGQSGQGEMTGEGKAADEARVADIEDVEVAARNPRVIRRPTAPTKAMVLAHELHHAEYRDWCEHCVAGKGVSHQHKQVEREHDTAEFSIDYGFMTHEGVIDYDRNAEETEKAGSTPVLVGYDHQSKGIWAMVVDHKGPTPSTVQWLTDRIDKAGCKGVKIVLRSDQEESIKALKKAVAVKRQAETVMLESPVRDSRANGAAERAIRTWAAQVRTLRHQLEYKLQEKVDKDSALMTWLVSWAGEVICRYRIQTYGRTAYEYTTGHQGLQACAIFGERLMFQYTPDKVKRRKMESDWDYGYFMGIDSSTGEYIIVKNEASSHVPQSADCRRTSRLTRTSWQM